MIICTIAMGIGNTADAMDKELDMQLYKLAVATLIMGMTASLAHAGDAAPAVDQSTLGRIVKDRIIVVSHCKSSVPFSYCDNQ